jgi:excisionase family DNA binding protein
MTPHEVAAYFRIDLRTVYRLIKDRKIPCRRIGGQHRFRLSELEVWWSQQPGVSVEMAVGDAGGTLLADIPTGRPSRSVRVTPPTPAKSFEEIAVDLKRRLRQER